MHSMSVYGGVEGFRGGLQKRFCPPDYGDRPAPLKVNILESSADVPGNTARLKRFSSQSAKWMTVDAAMEKLRLANCNGGSGRRKFGWYAVGIAGFEPKRC